SEGAGPARLLRYAVTGFELAAVTRDRSCMYACRHSLRLGIGVIPRHSIFAFDRAEYWGRCAGVGYSIRVAAWTCGDTPAASKMRRANSYQEIGSPPATWKIPRA